MGGKLTSWVIYDHPKDYPDFYVARKFHGENPASEHYLAGSLNEIRAMIPRGLFRIVRGINDELSIVETWL